MDIRETIVEASLKLLREHGFAALSQPRIAAGAGVRQSHLTYYFPARADLLLAVANRSCEVLLAPLHEKARRGDLTPDHIAERLGAAVTDVGMARIFHTLVSVSEEDVSLKPQMARLQRDSVHDLRELFGGAGLRLSEDEGLILHALICGTSTMCLCKGTPAARREAREVLRNVVRMLVEKHAGAPAAKKSRPSSARKTSTKKTPNRAAKG